MTSAERHFTATEAARRRRVGQVINARRALARPRVGGRAWLNGREVGGVDPGYMHLEASHD